jgi:hypothetical protein
MKSAAVHENLFSIRVHVIRREGSVPDQNFSGHTNLNYYSVVICKILVIDTES